MDSDMYEKIKVTSLYYFAVDIPGIAMEVSLNFARVGLISDINNE